MATPSRSGSLSTSSASSSHEGSPSSPNLRSASMNASHGMARFLKRMPTLLEGELAHAPIAGQMRAQRQPTRVGHMSKLDIYSNPIFDRRSSIICTIGPNTNSVEALGKLMDSGMNIVRMNFSHGSYEYHGSVIANTRLANAQRPDTHIAIALPWYSY